MPFKIAIASGKGGTGKTTLAVNIFQSLSKTQGLNVSLVDCDVEEPNDLIFFQKASEKSYSEISQLIPEIENENCTYCRKCAEYCEFNAIVVIPSIKFAEVNASLCHSCGACLVACEENAITEKPKPLGKVTNYHITKGSTLIEGKLLIGSAMQTMLIRELKKRVPASNDIIIFDSPPGTSCPVVEVVNDSDYVLLVSEPTPFGLHDLKIMVELLKSIQKPFGVIINKAGLGDGEIYKYIAKEKIELLGEIPFSQEYASDYANGNLFEDVSDEITSCYSHIIEKLERRWLVSEGNNNIER